MTDAFNDYINEIERKREQARRAEEQRQRDLKIQ